MSGLYLIPDVANYETPGQVPRLDPTTDRGWTGRGPANVDADFVRALVSRELGAPNEITFRQGIMASMLEQGVAPTMRRAILAGAVKLYRSRLSKGGHGDGAHLQARIRDLIRD